MNSILVFLAVFLLGTCVAQNSTVNNDLAVLNYALTLEHLEAAFYQQGITTYSQTDFTAAGYPSYTYSEFARIAGHETTHVNTLIAVIEASYPGQSVPACQYSFPMHNVNDFVAIARSLERTGVSAYLGRVADITSKGYLVAAASIVTIEARHASFINVLSQYSGMPMAFDTPIGPRAIVSIASTLITSCPYDLGVTPYPTLSLTTLNSAQVSVMVNGMSLTGSAMLYCCFWGSNQTFTSIVGSVCSVPSFLSGDIYVFVTNNTTPITLSPMGDSGVMAGPAVYTVDQGFKLAAATTTTQAPTSASTTQAPTSASTTQAPTSASTTQASNSGSNGGNVININFAYLLSNR